MCVRSGQGEWILQQDCEGFHLISASLIFSWAGTSIKHPSRAPAAGLAAGPRQQADRQIHQKNANGSRPKSMRAGCGQVFLGSPSADLGFVFGARGLCIEIRGEP